MLLPHIPVSRTDTYCVVSIGAKSECLDHILLHRRHRQPRAANVRVQRLMAPEGLTYTYGSESYMRDLSDHYPVLGVFEF